MHAFSIANVLTAALLLVGNFWGIPVRDARLDGGVLAIALAFLLAAVASRSSRPRSIFFARALFGILTVMGLVLVVGLLSSVAFLAEVHGPVGRGGAVLYLLVVALVLPYLVVLPAVQFVWLGGRQRVNEATKALLLLMVGIHLWFRESPREERVCSGREGAACEEVVAQGALASFGPLFALGVAPLQDGIAIELGSRRDVLTPRDLVRHRAYDAAYPMFELGVGVDKEQVIALFAARLGMAPPEIKRDGRFRRLRFRSEPPPPATSAEAGRRAGLAADYLARVLRADGTFEYRVDGLTGRASSDYEWTRHAGAAFFLARAARVMGSPTYRSAAGVSLRRLHREWDGREPPNWGMVALSLLAESELLLEPPPQTEAKEIRAFLNDDLRALSLREKGAWDLAEHENPYAPSETAFALARASRVTGDAFTVDQAARLLAHVVNSWKFFASHAYPNEEHWTCLAAAELWDRRPSEQAVAHCLRFLAFAHASQRAEPPFHGGFSALPFVIPPLTPAASRAEAMGAILEILPPKERDVPRAWFAETVGFLGRYQASEEAIPKVLGGMPNSPAGLEFRIDFTQHAGNAWLTAVSVLP